MQLTRFLVVGALVVVLAAAGAVATGAVAAAGGPANRGWSSPVGAADEFAAQPG